MGGSAAHFPCLDSDRAPDKLSMIWITFALYFV
jgi:hypothetical protein